MNTLTIETPWMTNTLHEVWYDDEGTILRVWKQLDADFDLVELSEREIYTTKGLHAMITHEIKGEFNSRVSSEQNLFDEYY